MDRSPGYDLSGRPTYPHEESGEPAMPPLKTYFEADCPPLSALKGKRALVIGYGLQGEPTALNLRDSGIAVTTGVRLGGPSEARAKAEGFPTHESNQPIPADIEAVFVLVPDQLQAEVLRNFVLPSMHPGQILIFANGFVLLYGSLPMPKGVDVVVLEPHGPGSSLRARYLEGSGLPAQVALWRDPSGTAFTRALQWGAALGYAHGGMRPTTVKREVDLDLFVEQTLLCGGLVELALAVYETAVARGYDPEQAWKSTIGEVGNTAMLLQQHGPVGLYKRISEVALKGSLLNGSMSVPPETLPRLNQVLDQIESGAFVKALESTPIQEQIRRKMGELKGRGYAG